VCIFGASWAKEGDELYELSVSLGRALARAGYDVVTGGYGGTMEGISKGAREVSDAEVVGVTVPTLFPLRSMDGNPYLTKVIEETSLLSRIDRMMQRSPKAKIGLPGTLGTLTEIMCAWNVAALAPIGSYTPSKLILWRYWEKIVSCACESMNLSSEQRELIVYVDSVEDCLKALS
jgi:uncharacterized protein (TIGR00730 family)